jgi:hypothetical protein
MGKPSRNRSRSAQGCVFAAQRSSALSLTFFVARQTQCAPGLACEVRRSNYAAVVDASISSQSMSADLRRGCQFSLKFDNQKSLGERR